MRGGGKRLVGLPGWLLGPANGVRGCSIPLKLPAPYCAGKVVSARTLAHYGVVLTTYQTMALEAPRKEGAGGGAAAKKKAAAAAAAAGAGGSAAAAAAAGAAGEDDDFIDLLSDSEEEQLAAQQARQAGVGAKRQKVSPGGGKAAAAAAAPGSGKAKPLFDIFWHRQASSPPTACGGRKQGRKPSPTDVEAAGTHGMPPTASCLLPTAAAL